MNRSRTSLGIISLSFIHYGWSMLGSGPRHISTAPCMRNILEATSRPPLPPKEHRLLRCREAAPLPQFHTIPTSIRRSQGTRNSATEYILEQSIGWMLRKWIDQKVVFIPLIHFYKWQLRGTMPLSHALLQHSPPCFCLGQPPDLFTILIPIHCISYTVRYPEADSPPLKYTIQLRSGFPYLLPHPKVRYATCNL